MIMHKQVLVVKSEGKGLVGRPRYRSEDNIQHVNTIFELIQDLRFIE